MVKYKITFIKGRVMQGECDSVYTSGDYVKITQGSHITYIPLHNVFTIECTEDAG